MIPPINNDKGFSLFSKSGDLYHICKAEDQPDNCIGLPVKDVQQCNATSIQFIENLDILKNDIGFLDRLYTYLQGGSYIQSNITESEMIQYISDTISSRHLLVFPIENNTPLFKKILRVKSESPIILEKVEEQFEKEKKVRFVPVRYALDEFQALIKVGENKNTDVLTLDEENIKEPHGLPPSFPGGHFRKDRSGVIDVNKYTLRQLPDGFLYVWDDVHKQMHEYKVVNTKGKVLLTRFKFDGNEAQRADDDRGMALEDSKVYLEYDKNSILYIVYSQLRWSWRLIEEFRGDAVHPDPKIQLKARKSAAARRAAWARKIVCSSLYNTHTGLASEILPKVADFDTSDSYAAFPLTTPSLKAREADIDGEFYTAKGNPIQSSNDYITALEADIPSDVEILTAQVVALDDLSSEVNDMVAQIKYLESNLYESQEGELEWRATAMATVELCGGGVDSELLPTQVRGNDVAVKTFQKDLIALFESLKIYKEKRRRKKRDGSESITQGEIDAFLKQQNKFKEAYFIPPTILNVDIDPSLQPDEKQKALQFKQLEAEQEFERKYFSDLTAYNRWLKHEDKKRYLSKKTALDEVIVHLKYDQDLMFLITQRVNELFKCLFKIPKNGAAWLGYDTTLCEDHEILMQWITNCYDVMLPHLEDKQRVVLNREMFENKNAKCLVGVSIYGFEEEIRDSLTTALTPLQNTIDKQAQASEDAQNTALNKDLADSYLITNDIIDSMESYSLYGHKWVEQLSTHGQKVMSALREANSNVKSLGILLLQGISISAGDTGVAQIASSLKLYLMDSYMSKGGERALYYNKNRDADLSKWMQQYDEVYRKWLPIQNDIDKLRDEVFKLHGDLDRVENVKGKGKPHVKGKGGKRYTVSDVRYIVQQRTANKISELMDEIESSQRNIIRHKSDTQKLEHAADKLQKDKVLLQKFIDELNTDMPKSLSRRVRTLKIEGIMANIKGLNAKIKAAAPEVEEFRVKRLELKSSFPKFLISTPEMTVNSESDILDKAIKSAVKNPKKTNWSGTGFTVAAVLLNMVNLYLVQKSTPEYEDLDFSFASDSSNAFDTFATISSAAYLGQAITLLFASASNNLIDEVMKSIVLNPKKLDNFYKIRHRILDKSRGILQIPTHEALNKFKNVEQKKFLTYLKRTKIFYRLLGGFTVIATVYEMAPLLHKTFGRKGNQLNKVEKTLSVIKASTLAVSIIGGFYSLGLGFGVLAGFVWAVPVLAAVSVVYIISAIALDLLIRDEYERWLDHSRYGTDPLWIDDIDTEYQQLLFLMMKPSVYVQPTYFLKLVTTDHGSDTFTYNKRIRTGYYVMLRLPEPNCQVEVAEVIPEWIGGKQGVSNSNLAIINPIWLTDFQYKMVVEYGLPNDINAKLVDNKWLSAIDSEDEPKGSLTCLLRLPLTDIAGGNFILRIIRADRDMIWEYDINKDVFDHGQIIKDTFKGTDVWPADISPVKLPLYSQCFNQSTSDKNA